MAGTNGEVTPEQVYEFLHETLTIARILTERLVWLEEPALAQNASYIHQVLGAMVDSELRSQVEAITPVEAAA